MDMIHQQNIPETSANARQRTPRTYNFLLRLSRRLGNVATQRLVSHQIHTVQGTNIITSLGNVGSSMTLQPANSAIMSTNYGNLERDKMGILSDRDEKLRNIVSRSHEVLISVNTVFPITVFPDTVTVDRTKVTITRRDFFWTSDVMSIRIEDVLNVSASVGPLFGSLTIASRVMSTIDHFKINHFWRNDAIRLKHIIQGYVIAQHNSIDTTHLSKNELIDTLRELGHDSNI